MTTVVLFVIIMDILTYCFGIDLTRTERELLRKKNYIRYRKGTFSTSTRSNSISVSPIQLFDRSNSSIELRMI